jgi:hypothetical protein
MNIAAFFERRGWIILLIISITFLLFGIGDIIQGMDADPAIAEGLSGLDWDEVKESQPELARLITWQMRAGGGNILILSLFSIAIILKPYRRGEQWAWVTLWVLPLWTVLIFAMIFFADRPADSPTPPPMFSAPIFLVLIALTLLMSYRKFFPSTQASHAPAQPMTAEA